MAALMIGIYFADEEKKIGVRQNSFGDSQLSE